MGTRLVSKLTAQGHTVRVLTRNPGAAAGKLPYPRVEVYGPERWDEAVKGSTVVINLAGGHLLTVWDPLDCIMTHAVCFVFRLAK